MAHAEHIPYAPLAHDLYHDPSFPLPASFESPPVELTSLPQPMSRPGSRYFQGNTEFRDSILSQSTFHTAPSAVNSSVYALHPNASGADFTRYQDDPASASTGPSEPGSYLELKRAAYPSPRSRSKRTILLLGSIAAIVVILAIVIPVYFFVIKPKSVNATAPNPTTSEGSGAGSIALVTGGNGSTIATENGTTFTYLNPFGGTWYWDPNDPFNNNAQPNSWTPPLNQSFNFGTDRIFGSVFFGFGVSSS